MNKLQILLKFAEEIIREKDLNCLLSLLSDVARDILEVDRCSLFLSNPENKTLWTIVAHGVKKIEIPWDKGIAGWVFRNGKSLIVNDAYSDSRFEKSVDAKTGYRTRNILAVPLINRKGEVIGVFQAINKLKGDFTEEDEDLLTLLSGYAASAIENAALYIELNNAYKDTVLRLSHAAEFKDRETKNHILRTGLYAREIAEYLGLDEELETVFLATQMHDIGKIGIPDSILLKPGKLTDEERKIMEQHTIIGYEILKGSKSKLLQIAALIALEHHEKVDGSGYPYGKKGEEISIYGRIACVVDVFDALISDRPYKKAWPEEKVFAFLKENIGKMFDEDVVNAVFKRKDKLLRIKREFKDEYEGD
ncbi:HD-GYP domain-containing protein [Desulfurobacterium atlanticum]|uniref:GAF domain-containing protein n=1 Tax=Desulfurobacterium atlanticum TaxID=240169 RepID=A0A238YMB2_9BACT|nr:HD domain-containing phosphohydrolase [Desulfurobacterium atlanticum]SNR72267.1 GAF domain-containing protein [Desulfurobacterium atlanticum]